MQSRLKFEFEFFSLQRKKCQSSKHHVFHVQIFRKESVLAFPSSARCKNHLGREQEAHDRQSESLTFTQMRPICCNLIFLCIISFHVGTRIRVPKGCLLHVLPSFHKSVNNTIRLKLFAIPLQSFLPSRIT